MDDTTDVKMVGYLLQPLSHVCGFIQQQYTRTTTGEQFSFSNNDPWRDRGVQLQLSNLEHDCKFTGGSTKRGFSRQRTDIWLRERYDSP